MISVFRDFAKSWAAKLLFGVLVIAFGFWGIQGALVPKISTDVITAGQRHISETEFRALIDNQLNRMRQETGQAPTIDQLVKAGVPTQWANQLAQDTAQNAWIEKAGINPAKSLSFDTLKEIPNLAGAFNPITGAFDQKAFRQILGQAGMNENTFLQGLHDEIASRHLSTAIQAGTQAPKLYAALEAEFLMQTRDASFFVLQAPALGAPPQPTEADLQKLYKDLGDRVRRPETRTLTVVLFNPHSVAGTVTVDPAEVRKTFDFRKDSYSTPEKRTFVQIPAKDAATATRIAQALRGGSTPDAAAKANGSQAQVLTDLARTAVPDPKVAQAVFGLQQGQVSDAIHGDLGWAVVKVQAITPGRAAAFEEKKAEIEGQLKQRAAQDKIQDMLQKYSDARDSGASALAAAAKVGAETHDLPPLTAEGQTLGGAPINIPQPVMQKVVSAGFGLPKGGQSEPQALGQAYPGIYYAVVVKDVRAAYKPTLDEVRGEVAQAWTQQAMAARLKAKGDELLGRLRKGEPIAQVAASVHAQVQHQADVERAMSQSNDPRAVISNVIFSAPKGQPFAVPVNQANVVIGQVEAVHSPATPRAAEVVAGRAQTAVSRGLAQDLLAGVQESARTQIKPTVDARNLNAALGLNEQGKPVQ